MRPDIKRAIDLYASEGHPVGDFLYAVLSNNLKNALGRADSDNERDIKEIVMYVYWEIPGDCWGSEKKVDDWLEKKCAERMAARSKV